MSKCAEAGAPAPPSYSDNSRMGNKRIRVTQGSCWQCKKRRVRCDTKKPLCSRCVEAGNSCDYSKVHLRWHKQRTAQDEGSAAVALSNSLSLHDPDWRILYFVREVMSRFSLLEAPREADLEGFQADKVFNQAVLAVSAAHSLFSRPPVSETYQNQSIHIRNDAIKMLRQSLQTPLLAESASTVFQTNVLLCMLDGIIDPRTEGAAPQLHFEGGKAIMRCQTSIEESASQAKGLSSVLLSIYATMDLTNAVFTGKQPIFGPGFWTGFLARDAWWSGLDCEVGFLHVMESFARLAQQSHDAYITGLVPPISDLLTLQLALKPSTSHSNATGSTQSSPDASERSQSQQDADAFCSTYSSAALIYMYRTLCNLGMDHDLVQQAVQSTIQNLSQTHWLGKKAHCLLFPFVIIGSHCTRQDQRQVILDSLSRSADFLCFGSVAAMRDFLNETWLNQDSVSCWWTHFEPLAQRAFIF